MTTDEFLVQKLKEIILRLYPTPQTSPIIMENGSTVSNYKFPKLFLSLSESRGNHETEGLVKYESNSNLFGRGESEIGYKFENTSLFQEEDGTFLGVVHNMSAVDHVAMGESNMILGNTTTVISNARRDLYETALARNLHEFIQILKMSLNPEGKSNREGNGGVNGGVDGGGSGGGVTTNFMATDGLSPNDLEFNLTLDDIMDLNMLLDGSESVLQFKHGLIIFLYFLIAVVSIVGNLLVVQLVIRSRRLHTLTHALLANLAAADLFMATLNIPFSAARVIMAEWPFGPVLCHLVPFVQVTSVYVTSITMAVIAIDRYSVIMNPLGRRMKSSHGVLLVLGIWVLSGLLSLPYAIHHKVVRVLTVGVVSRCQADFGSFRPWLTVGTFLAQYLVPLAFTTVSYFSIMQRLRQRTDALGSTTPRQIEAQSRAKKKTIKMLALTVVFFAVSWAPINIYHLLTHFSLVRHNSTAILVCHLIAMSSCTVNPFIYCWFNDHFRREALKWMRCFRTRRDPIVRPGVEMNGMLTRADQACGGGTQSTTFASMSLRSPRLPHSYSHQGHLIGRNNHQTTFIECGSTHQSEGTYQVPSSLSSLESNRKLRPCFDDPLTHYGPKGHLTKIDVEVRYTERPESHFLVRTHSYEDIFTANCTTTTRTQRAEPMVGVMSASDEEEEDDDYAQDYLEALSDFHNEKLVCRKIYVHEETRSNRRGQELCEEVDKVEVGKAKIDDTD